MKKNWAAEARGRISEDFQKLAMAFVVQRCAVSERMLRLYGFSKTQQRKAQEESDSWLRTRLTRLNVLEVLLRRRQLLGKLVWWLYNRLLTQMQRPPKMRSNPAAVPADQRDPTKGAQDGVAHEAVAEAVPPA